MRIRFFNLLATVFAVLAGLATLLGYFLGPGRWQDVRQALLTLVSLLAAWAVLAGALNLMLVHSKKFLNQSPGWFYSLFAIIAFAAVILANLLAPVAGWGAGAANAVNNWILIYLLSSGGAALAGLVAFFLVFAGYRVLRTRPSLTMVIFVITVVVALLVLAPWPTGMPNPTVAAGTTLRDLLRALTQIPAMAGARGLLLGIALGAIATGVRVLIGLDRPYGD